MRCFVYGLVLGIAVSLLTTAQSFAGVAPAAPWQITIQGQDRGVMFLTFLTDTPPTNSAIGYGISLDALGPFTFAGTWDFNPNDDITCGFIQTTGSESRSGSLIGKTVGNGGFQAQVTIPHDAQKYKAPAPDAVPDLSGSWNGWVISNGKKVLQQFNLTPSTNNMPGWFDLTGTGMSDNGSFAIAGAVLVTSDRSAAGYTISNFGTSTTQASFVGKVSPKANKMTLKGKDEDTQNVTFKAQKPKTK